jgi:hypothetical protein
LCSRKCFAWTMREGSRGAPWGVPAKYSQFPYRFFGWSKKALKGINTKKISYRRRRTGRFEEMVAVSLPNIVFALVPLVKKRSEEIFIRYKTGYTDCCPLVGTQN